MRILITGASGFLGTHLCHYLATLGWDVTGLSSKDADLTDPGALDKYSKNSYEKIFHLAAWTQAGDFCLYHQGEQWLINQQINTNVLRWWHEKQPKSKLISIGTSCVYEEGGSLKEQEYLQGTPIESLYTYAMTKRMLLIGQKALAKQFGSEWLTVVPSTLYGAGYHIGTKQMHFIFDLAWKILRGKHNGDDVVLWGDGSQRRELVDVGDFVKILVYLDEKCSNEVINIGAGYDFSIKEVANSLCEIIGYDKEKLIFDTTRYVGAHSKMLNVERLESLYPNRPVTPLSSGLRNLVLWLEPLFIKVNNAR